MSGGWACLTHRPVLPVSVTQRRVETRYYKLCTGSIVAQPNSSCCITSKGCLWNSCKKGHAGCTIACPQVPPTLGPGTNWLGALKALLLPDFWFCNWMDSCSRQLGGSGSIAWSGWISFHQASMLELPVILPRLLLSLCLAPSSSVFVLLFLNVTILIFSL